MSWVEPSELNAEIATLRARLRDAEDRIAKVLAMYEAYKIYGEPMPTLPQIHAALVPVDTDLLNVAGGYGHRWDSMY